MAKKDLLYQNGWSYQLNELGDFGFYLDLTVLRATEQTDDLVGVLLTRRYTIEESERFSITDAGAHARVPVPYHTSMGASVSMNFRWVERNSNQDIYRFNVDFELSIDSPAAKYTLQSATGEFNLREPPLPSLEGQMTQSFTTRAGIVNSEIFVVIDTMPWEPEEPLMEDFFDLVGPAETKTLNVSDLSVEQLVTMLLQDGDSPEPYLTVAVALLAQTQIVVAHSPLTVEPLASSLNYLAAAGGTALLLTHPHLMPIAVLSWAGLDIFVRVQREGGDRVDQQQAELTDKLFEMMHTLRRNARKSKRAIKRAEPLVGKESGSRQRESEA